MIKEELNQKLLERFPDDIYTSFTAHKNEVYLEVNPKRIMDISVFLNREYHYPLISMFANDERKLSGKYMLYYAFADRNEGFTFVLKTAVEPEKMTFVSIGDKVYAAALYEKEIHDLFGLAPSDHPNLKRLVHHSNWPDGSFPLRKDFSLNQKLPFVKKKIHFKKVAGEGVYEIPVGPVHAGIIEPGHFRFSVAGEPIINLEAQLYFVHKGIEKLCEGESIEKCFYISERISGDETFTNSLAYCQAVEKIAAVEIPVRAAFTRVVIAELERLTSHFGDLAGICLDVAFGFAAFQFRMLRGWAYLVAEELCGSRFLRSANRPGGVRREFISGKEKSVIDQLKKIEAELRDTEQIVKLNSMFMDRVENTGILKHNVAVDLNAVGPGARASGIEYDLRKGFPYAAYGSLKFDIAKYTYGDVNCRMKTKIDECFQSISLMIQAIEAMPEGPVFESLPKLEPYKFAFGMTEAPRGENIHWLMSGENNTIFRYKIRTPSFCNWPALCHAVKGNIVPDFPLINKSFNLSYAGNDL